MFKGRWRYALPPALLFVSLAGLFSLGILKNLGLPVLIGSCVVMLSIVLFFGFVALGLQAMNVDRYLYILKITKAKSSEPTRLGESAQCEPKEPPRLDHRILSTGFVLGIGMGVLYLVWPEGVVDLDCVWHPVSVVWSKAIDIGAIVVLVGISITGIVKIWSAE